MKCDVEESVMTMIAEPVSQQPVLADEYSLAPPHRYVTVVVDACCELDPALAAEQGILLVPRVVRADRQTMTLNAERTLHYSCWPDPPRRLAPAPHALGDLAQAYDQVLCQGLSVLALHLPGRLDPTARLALAARSILMAGQRGDPEHAPRAAVYELAAAGLSFAFLVAAAARGAAMGLTLQQLLTLLDRLQAALRDFYLTGLRGPAEAMRLPGAPAGVARLGSTQVWELDHASGLFACRARSWGLTQALDPRGPLGLLEPTIVCGTDARQIERLNAARAAAQKDPLPIQPGGLSLKPLFSHGAVELALLPDEAHIEQIIDVIRRIDRSTTPLAHGRRWREGT
jgi:hypothetical protein